jgi:type II secretory pathway component PulJ
LVVVAIIAIIAVMAITAFHDVQKKTKLAADHAQRGRDAVGGRHLLRSEERPLSAHYPASTLS